MKTLYHHPRQTRLRKTADISAVFQGGTRVRGRFMDVIEATSSEPMPRLGVIVSKRGHSAVERNTVRRRLREIARTNWLPAQREAGGKDLIVRARAEAYGASRSSLAADFERCILEAGC